MNPGVHVIAEAGTNHNGSRETAEKLVEVAVAAGADSVKFQMIYPEGLYLPKLFRDGAYVDNDVFQKRAAGMLSDDDYRSLAALCRTRGIGFSASVFDRRGIDLLDELNVGYIKIASCDLNNSRLLVEVAERGRHLVISTGMASLGEIERAVSDVAGTGNTNLVLMHCISVYPCPTERMNLGFLTTLRQAFGFPVGLSDHTEQSLAGAIAVALGVEWVEKHFTLNRASEGFDHAYAMEPEGLAWYVRDIRAAAEACARAKAKVGPTEAAVKGRARRALYAARDLQPGEPLAEADVLIVRPEGPLAPNDLSLVLGRVVRRTVRQYEALSLEMFN